MQLKCQTRRRRAEQGARIGIELRQGKVAGNRHQTIDINHRIARNRETERIGQTEIKGGTDVGLGGGITPVEFGFTIRGLIQTEGAIRHRQGQRG